METINELILGVEFECNTDPNLIRNDNYIKVIHIRNWINNNTPSAYCNILSICGTLNKDSESYQKITQIAIGYSSRDSFIKYRFKDGDLDWSQWIGV